LQHNTVFSINNPYFPIIHRLCTDFISTGTIQIFLVSKVLSRRGSRRVVSIDRPCLPAQSPKFFRCMKGPWRFKLQKTVLCTLSINCPNVPYLWLYSTALALSFAPLFPVLCSSISCPLSHVFHFCENASYFQIYMHTLDGKLRAGTVLVPCLTSLYFVYHPMSLSQSRT
jgi:hypothetical protein